MEKETRNKILKSLFQSQKENRIRKWSIEKGAEIVIFWFFCKEKTENLIRKVGHL